MPAHAGRTRSQGAVLLTHKVYLTVQTSCSIRVYSHTPVRTGATIGGGVGAVLGAAGGTAGGVAAGALVGSIVPIAGTIIGGIIGAIIGGVGVGWPGEELVLVWGLEEEPYMPTESMGRFVLAKCLQSCLISRMIRTTTAVVAL